MITVRYFEPRDIASLTEMLKSQDYPDLKGVTLESLPDVGVIAHAEGIPAAAGFLRMVEGQVAQIDGLTSNAELPSATRHEALNEVVSHLVQAAKVRGLKGLLAFTKDKSVLMRAEVRGFTVLPHVVMSLSLED